MSDLAVIVVLCGAGTFLLRLLPIWQARRRPRASAASGRLRAFLQGIGPAAITALLVVSLWPALKSNEPTLRAMITVLALAIIYAIKRWRGGIAGPTLAGAFVYGILMHLLA